MSTSNNINLPHYKFPREAQEASTASPQKDSTCKIDKNTSVMEKPVPEICTSGACGGSGSKTPENDCSASNTSVDSTSKTVSVENQMLKSNSCLIESIFHKIFQKKLSLEEENRQLKDARLCKVCMDDDVAVVFLPCGHLGEYFDEVFF